MHSFHASRFFKYSCLGTASALIAIAVLFIFIPSAGAASLTPQQEQELAALSLQLKTLQDLLLGLKDSLVGTASAQTTTTCPSGYHSMYYSGSTNPNYCQSDTSSTSCQPLGGGSTYTCPTTTYTTTPPPSSSTCSSSLISLLGTGCHYMYNDTAGKAVYCDGPMTKSAKDGDTTTTTGCSSGGSSTYTYTSTTTTSTSCGTGYYWYTPPTGSGYCTPNTTTTTTTSSSSANLTATVSGADIMLTWTDFYQGENNYWIERKVGSGSWAKIGESPSLAGGNGTYKDLAVPSGTYDYHVRACLTSGCVSDSNVATITIGGSSTSTTAPTTATPAPVISSIAVTNITSSSATIGWTTDIPANSRIEYGISTPSSVISSGTFSTSHTISLSGLAASTTYTYNVISENQDYYRTTFSNKTFSTVAMSQTTTSCPSGYHSMYSSGNTSSSYCQADSSTTVCQPLGGGATYTCPTTTTITTSCGTGYYWYTPSTGSGYCKPNETIATTTTTSSTCSSALITLLGTGCHYMYNDASANPIYCDGPMTKSAKTGDTTTTAGCSGGGIITSPAGQKNQIWNSFGLTSSIRVDADPARIEQLKQACVNVSGSSSIWTPRAGDPSSVDFGMPDPEKCRLAAACPSGQYFNGTSCGTSGLYSGSGCGVNTSQTSCVGANSSNSACAWISGTGYAYCESKPSYAGDTTSCPGFAYSRWDSTNKRYCQLNNFRACQYTYPDYLDSSKYNATNCPAEDNTGGGGSGIPNAPTGLAATLQTSGEVKLVWNDNATNENEYRIEWKNFSGIWTVVGSIGILYGGTGAYSDHPSSGRTHEYRVKACNAAGCSGESNVASITVGGEVSAPILNSMAPSSGPIGTVVTITGTRFTPTGNRINFDTGVIMNIPSSDGTTLIFKVPEDRVPLCAVTEPRCLLPAPYNLVKPGTYPISLTNANGTSNTFSFTVTETAAANFAVDPAVTYPKSGAIGIDVGTRIKVKLNREFDQKSTYYEFFRLTKSDTPSTRVQGSFSMYSEGFEFILSEPLEANTSYTYSVFAMLRDRTGVALTPFNASFTTSGSISKTSGTLTGKVLGPDGAGVARAFVYVYSEQPRYYTSYAAGQGSFWRNTETDSNGAFQMSVPAGVYLVDVYVPQERTDVTRSSPQPVAIAAGDTKTLTINLSGTVKIITGAVTFSNATPVTDAQVGAYSSASRQWTNTPVGADGRYTLRVGTGTWVLGIHPKDGSKAAWSWNEPPASVTFSKDQTAETKTVNFTVPVQDATLIVSAVDDAGAPFGNVGIVADTQSAVAVSSSASFMPPQFRIAGVDGKAKFTLRSGTVFVRAYVPPDRGYFNPDEQQVSFASGDTKEVKLIFRKKQQVGALTIGGVTKFDDGTSIDALVWAWSERGGFTSARADLEGKFGFIVSPNERWHVGAGKEYKDFPYKSSEIIVVVKNESVNVELVLTKQGTTPLPPIVNVTQSAKEQIVAQATDGTKLVLPPSSAASTGNVRVEIKPTVEAPTQAGTDVVSTVYDVTVRDTGGKEVTTLNSKAELVLPYDEEELKAQGVTEDEIVPSYYDEATGTWVEIDDYTIDKERNVVIVKVDHLTRFAITAKADTTPPDAPTGVSATAISSGKIRILWKNPAKDFDYVKVYRSLKAGELGTVRAAMVRAAVFMDEEGLTNGITYYYTVRAVDPAGNESGNTAQVSAAAVGTSAAAGAKVKVTPATVKGGVLGRTLSQGMKGDDVKTLQQFLAKEGLYTGPITGALGQLTKDALIKFQEKYATELLKPYGLTKGSGIAGTATRKKINTLLGK